MFCLGQLYQRLIFPREKVPAMGSVEEPWNASIMTAYDHMGISPKIWDFPIADHQPSTINKPEPPRWFFNQIVRASHSETTPIQGRPQLLYADMSCSTSVSANQLG